MKKFDSAKNRSNKKWYELKTKNYSFYIWAIPVVPVVFGIDKLKRIRYKRLVWSDEKATKLLNKILPKVVEWVEEDKAYYYCMEWSSWGLSQKASLFNRKWVKKFSNQLHNFIEEGYENPNYNKVVEKDSFETWVKFTEK